MKKIKSNIKTINNFLEKNNIGETWEYKFKVLIAELMDYNYHEGYLQSHINFMKALDTKDHKEHLKNIEICVNLSKNEPDINKIMGFKSDK